ncbi:hypothetical protein DN752_03990 [Echinicola strongylocentroti]|uniref:Uncharacterized protein n=1 Tax=Echinicola strongylocentroti TaxID=1795355 RepID=A0A2Z4IF17_9BACT|nr:hypothetical protein [Echinicola strongylocentroti]AWW29369.1 hypothetical protein DN752_03990 [Echinicola strongylocentroti]
MKYLIKIEINDVEFQIHTEASSEREAKDNVWEIIREKTSVKSIETEALAPKDPSLGRKLAEGIRSALLL